MANRMRACETHALDHMNFVDDYQNFRHSECPWCRIRELKAALLDLYSGTAEYVYLNHLGDPHNTTPMRNAAKALGAPALEAYDRLRALHSTSDANVANPLSTANTEVKS